MIFTNEEKERLVHSLSWMIEDLKDRFDTEKGNTELFSKGGYSKELTAVINLLSDIEKIEPFGFGMGKIKPIFVNCREFGCKFNTKGSCGLQKVSFQSAQLPIVGSLKCVEAEAEKEEGDIGDSDEKGHPIRSIL